ncbi:MAG: hypothetical protein HOW97_11120 [Catenulispora sp.]|nr:hypothetical protein [Catenulispora sp.]
MVAAVLGLISVLMLWAGPIQGVGRAETDTVHYTQRAYEFAGDDQATATTKAVRFVCDDEVDYTDVPRDACERNTNGVLGFPHQYQAIFKARPGFPALMSLFIRAFGDQGIYLSVLFLQILTGVLLVLAARALGLPGLWPLAAEAAYFLLPSGFVGTRVLSEAASAPGLAALLYAAVLIIQNRRRDLGTGVAVAAFAWLFAVRAADAALAAVFLLLAGAGAYALRKSRQPWAERMAIVSGASLAAMVAISAALSWPTVNQGITDTMTEHFTQPVPKDMYIRFLHAEFRFWRAFLPMISGGAYLVVLAALGLWGVARWLRGWAAATFLAVAAVGAASLALHPGDWARMLAPMWLVVAVGLPLLLAPTPSGRRVRFGFRPAVAERGEEPAGVGEADPDRVHAAALES